MTELQTRMPERHGLRVLAVDDEPVAREDLAYQLAQDPRIVEVRTAASATEALVGLEAGDVDALFLDVTMPGMDGLSLARVLSRFTVPPLVVFVTAHEGHALAAFDLSAVDYVLKPVRRERLAEAIRRVCVARGAALDARSGADGGETVHGTHGNDGTLDDETIAVEKGRVTILLPRSQVTWVESVGDYVRLHTSEGDYLVRVPLSRLEERWGDAGFVRIHRSRLVALREIAQVRLDPGRLMTVHLHDGTVLAVSRRHIANLRDRIMRAGL